MLGSTRNIRVYVYGQAVDMRKGFNALYGLIEEEMGRKALSGDIYLFIGRDRKRAKAFLWDGTGVCLYTKRLERGCFARLWGRHPPRVQLTMSELQLFLEGSKEVGRLALSPKEFILNMVDSSGSV